ncbi:MAG: fadD 11 [Frankiales bacterium]|nr:fadD 11 [Frankiales bacterium]
MDLTMLLEMAAEGCPDRLAVGTKADGLSYAQLQDRARGLGAELKARGVQHVAMVDVTSSALPLLVYGASYAGLPFVPLNYRLADAQLQAMVTRIAPAVVVAPPEQAARFADVQGIEVVSPDELGALAEKGAALAGEHEPDGDAVAVLLFTSGTSGEPKGAVLRASHLVSYVLSSVEFLGADEDEAILVSVPPYHIAGISSVLTSVYAGRRMVQLASFSPEAWVELARREAITQAMVVPTMLGRILEVLERDGQGLPALRHLSYGGGRMPFTVVERALALLPDVDLVNAYGLTETSSTIAVLGPQEHRDAAASEDPAVRRRLGSVGRPLPSVEIEVRDVDGLAVQAGEQGEIYVRGEQVSGEYLSHRALDEEGWFPTRDRGWLDEDGFLYVDGRADDVIVRGAENLSPGEIEDVLLAHPAVAEAAVVGIPDTEWGEAVNAAVVLVAGRSATEQELQTWVRERLRSSKTPARVHFLPALPHNETGKLLRRVLRDELATA